MKALSVAMLLTVTSPDPSLLTSFMEGLLLPMLFVVAIYYAWGGVCYLFFRFFRTETESRMRDFLKFPNQTLFSSFFRHEVVTEKTLRDISSGGWSFALLAFVTLSLEHGNWTCEEVLTSIGLLFFGGHSFARGWYGLRCLRLLGLDSY